MAPRRSTYPGGGSARSLLQNSLFRAVMQPLPRNVAGRYCGTIVVLSGGITSTNRRPEACTAVASRRSRLSVSSTDRSGVHALPTSPPKYSQPSLLWITGGYATGARPPGVEPGGWPALASPPPTGPAPTSPLLPP